MDKQTKRNLSKGAVISAELKGHSITTTLSACGRSGAEDTQEISIVTKVANQALSKVVSDEESHN